MQKLAEFIDNILEKKIDPLFWFLNFFGIVSLRLYLDNFIARSHFPLLNLTMDIHNLLFFFLSFALVWLVLSIILNKKPFDLAYLMLWATLALIFPPIFDLIRTGGEVFWSFYLISRPDELFLQYATIFGKLPSGIVYFGTKITFIVGIICLAGMVFIKTKNIFRTILTAVGVYSALFFMAAFPSLFFYLGAVIAKKDIFSVQTFQIIQFFSQTKLFGVKLGDSAYALARNLNLIYFPLVILLLGYFSKKSLPKLFLAFRQNLRYPQLIFHGGLLFFGAGVGFSAYREFLNLNFFSVLAMLDILLCVFLAWEASVVVNDIFDYEIDLVSNGGRLLPAGFLTVKQYARFGIILFVLSLLGSLAVDYHFGVLLFIYQVIAWFYSAKPFRLKRITFLCSLVSALALLTIFFSGFIFFSPMQNISGLSWRIIFLLIITYTLSLPIKDFKDIVGDKKDHVRTIPVVFGEEKGRLIVGAGFFCSFVASVFLLNEPRLFWPASLSGSLAFLAMNNKKIHPRKIFWWILPLIMIYGLVGVWIIFF